MPKVHEGQLDAKGRTFGIVVSRFNDLVTTRLLDGALDCIKRHGGDDDNIEVAWVPGAFELPIAAQKLAATGRLDVVMCLGAIVRSDTPHFDYVAGESAKGIARVGLDTGIPCIFEVLATPTTELAVARAGGDAGNKGEEAALAAIETVRVLKSVPAAE